VRKREEGERKDGDRRSFGGWVDPIAKDACQALESG
jgi:hypothetical protein